MRIPQGAQPLSAPLGCIILAIPTAIGAAMILGFLMLTLVQVTDQDSAALIGLGVAGGTLLVGIVLGAISSWKNGLALNDWTSNGPILSYGDMAAQVKLTLPPNQEDAEEIANPPFEFRPARWSHSGCLIVGLLGVIPGALAMGFGLQDDTPFPARLVIGAMMGFIGFGVFGWVFGFLLGLYRDAVRG